LKRTRDGGFGEHLSNFSTELLKQNNEVEGKKVEAEMKKVEILERQEMRKERLEKSENYFKQIQAQKLEIEIERERLRMKKEHLAIVSKTMKKRQKMLDTGLSQEEVNALLPFPAPLPMKVLQGQPVSSIDDS
jgi:hypothetical protein